jgi:hypothetical protein
VKYRSSVFTLVEYQQQRVIPGENPQIKRSRVKAEEDDESIAAAMR